MEKKQSTLDRRDLADSGDDQPQSPGRRRFLGGVGVAPIAASVVGLPPLVSTSTAQAGDELSPGSREERVDEASRLRTRSGRRRRRASLPPVDHPTNGDEDSLPNFIASFTKGLPHNDLGEVDAAAFEQLRTALSTGDINDLAAVPLGCPDPNLQRRLVNPFAGLNWQTHGVDSHSAVTAVPPAFSSDEAAAEMIENYWQACLRDVPFDQYANNGLAAAAAAEIDSLGDAYQGPRNAEGKVTAQELFRGNLPGATIGPFASQFFLVDVPFGAQPYSQTIRRHLPGRDFMTEYSEWLSIQRGCVPSDPDEFDPVRRYYYDGRTSGSYVQLDALAQTYHNAMIIMLVPPDFSVQRFFGMNPGFGGMGTPFDPNHIYWGEGSGGGVGPAGAFSGVAAVSEGLIDVGSPVQILSSVWEVASRTAQNQWFQKWNVHRRMRPEVFAGRIHNMVNGAADYPISNLVLDSVALGKIRQLNNGSALLPMGHPEGSPLHPSYGAGHASVAGACVTLLKAYFDEDAVIPNPVMPNADGTKLVPWEGEDLTVGNELNKLAANVGCARNFAGVHFRMDNEVSYRLGEAFAISLLEDISELYPEPFDGFQLTTFDGESITVGGNGGTGSVLPLPF